MTWRMLLQVGMKGVSEVGQSVQALREHEQHLSHLVG